MMKFFVFTFIFLVSYSVNSQNAIRKYYDRLFPNNLHKQNEVLIKENDSLRKKNESISKSVIESNEITKRHVEEINTLKHKLNSTEENTKSSISSLQEELIKLKDSLYLLNFYKVNCIEETIGEGENPTFKNTCLWRNYRIIENGIPDRKGKYEWSTLVYSQNDSINLIPIKTLLKANSIDSLEALVNKRIQEEFEFLAETNRHCIPKHMKCPTFTLDNMRFVISDNATISFEVTLGLSPGCYTVDFISATFKISEIKEYFE